MNADIELVLVHDGNLWVCSNDTITARGDTIKELDHDIQRLLRESGNYTHGSQVRVFMGFDFDSLPTWLRQYHTHYFNRTVTLDL